MNIKLITSGFETNKPKHIEERAKELFNKLYSLLPKSKILPMKELISEEGLAVVLTKLHQVHSSRDQKIRMIDILGDPNFLYYAWCKIKENKGKSLGIDNIPIQNIGVGTIENLSKEILTGRYKPRPTKRVYIEKTEGQQRFIGIPTSRDKIVQQALKIILEPIFEPHFSIYSHGFRPGCSCHTALHEMQKEWKMVSYFINLDLQKFFDKLGYKQIIKALKVHCKDKKILSIIYEMLKTGYVSLTNNNDVNLEPIEGMPEGSIISPLLSNIVLNEFDKIVENLLLPKYNRREVNKPSCMSNEYYDATKDFSVDEYWLRYQSKKKVKPSTCQSGGIIKPPEVKVAQDKDISYYLRDETTERLWYVRYGDHFIFGFVGPKEKALVLASEIVYELGQFGVTVNSEKSLVVHHSKGIRFLSYNVFGKYALKIGGQKITRTELAFSPPLEKLFKRAQKRGFVMANKRGKVNSKLVARRYDKWLFLQPEEIVRRYRSIIRALIYYYQGCQQRSALYELLWMYKRSCAITLAHHHKFSSYKKAIEKYGSDLTVHYKSKTGKDLTIDCKIPNLAGGGRFKTKITESAFPQSIEKVFELPGNSVPKTLYILQPENELMCEVPNCPNQAEEWYYVKHKKQSKIIRSSKQNKVALCVKKLPVCKKHHILIQNGKYNGPSLMKLKGFIAED